MIESEIYLRRQQAEIDRQAIDSDVQIAADELVEIWKSVGHVVPTLTENENKEEVKSVEEKLEELKENFIKANSNGNGKKEIKQRCAMIHNIAERFGLRRNNSETNSS